MKIFKYGRHVYFIVHESYFRVALRDTVALLLILIKRLAYRKGSAGSGKRATIDSL